MYITWLIVDIPQIIKGAVTSRSIGCSLKISLDFSQRYLISLSDKTVDFEDSLLIIKKEYILGSLSLSMTSSSLMSRKLHILIALTSQPYK